MSDILGKEGAEHLYRMLQRVDPESAEKIPANDSVRVTRALEFYFQTGRTLSESQRNTASPPEFAGRIRVFALKPPRDELYRKIDERAAMHFDSGLVDEVKELIASGVPPESNALGSHGYRRVREYLTGERSLESARKKTAQDVRNYAKRQFTWFRKEPGVIWLEGFGDDPAVFATLLGELDLTPGVD